MSAEMLYLVLIEFNTSKRHWDKTVSPWNVIFTKPHEREENFWKEREGLYGKRNLKEENNRTLVCTKACFEQYSIISRHKKIFKCLFFKKKNVVINL